jgi:hypothetical protein
MVSIANKAHMKDNTVANEYLAKYLDETDALIKEITRTKGRLGDFTIIYNKTTDTFSIGDIEFSSFSDVLCYILNERAKHG